LVGQDQYGIAAGGVLGLEIRELNSGVIQAPNAQLAITAYSTGGQANAVQINSSYAVLDVVGATGDSVKLPPSFSANAVVHIKNDGDNSADVFPASGDDIGAGTNTAIALAAGASAYYIATVVNSTWTSF
jgi:hypothetical protein